jgi:hypothetical protein
VQVAVGPVEDGLQHAVKLVQPQRRRQDEAAPDRRLRADEVDADGHTERRLSPAATAALRHRSDPRTRLRAREVQQLSGRLAQLVEVHRGDRL